MKNLQDFKIEKEILLYLLFFHAQWFFQWYKILTARRSDQLITTWPTHGRCKHVNTSYKFHPLAHTYFPEISSVLSFSLSYNRASVQWMHNHVRLLKKKIFAFILDHQNQCPTVKITVATWQKHNKFSYFFIKYLDLFFLNIQQLVIV